MVTGNRFTPSHAVRSGRRYRYYVSAAPIAKTGADRVQVRCLATQEVEGAMIRILVEALTSPASCSNGSGQAACPPTKFAECVVIRSILPLRSAAHQEIERSPFGVASRK